MMQTTLSSLFMLRNPWVWGSATPSSEFLLKIGLQNLMCTVMQILRLAISNHQILDCECRSSIVEWIGFFNQIYGIRNIDFRKLLFAPVTISGDFSNQLLR